MINYKAMYLTMFHASGDALNILLDARDACKDIHNLQERYFTLAAAFGKATNAIIAAQLTCEEVFVVSGGQEEYDEKYKRQ